MMKAHAAAVILDVMIVMVSAEPRIQTIELICATQSQQNSSIYVPNFFATMENVGLQTRTTGFGMAASGSGPNANYGLAQCYGDLSLLDCALCYAEARTKVPQCHPRTGGRLYLDGCFMRFDNYSFYHEFTGWADRAVCTNRTRQGSAFQESVRKALSEAVSAAPTNKGYARGEVRAVNVSVYVLANCWRTINASACRACLEKASASLSGCLPSSEGWALYTGCFLRYSDADFLNPAPRNGSSRAIVTAVVIAAISIAVVAIIGVLIGVYLWKTRAIQKKIKGDADELLKILKNPNLNFKFSTLERATGGFNEENKLGQGGFGTVYKGVLPDGRGVAVKRLFFDSKHRAADFYNEVNIISSVEHKNLVRLLGCSCLGPESLLVYEYMPNQSLDRFIFDAEKGKTLNWAKRLDVIIGIAEGLAYLHEKTETRIIHRDIKASNILLDSKLRAKIADFGLARSFQEDKSHISTAVAGTLGYMAPEYLAYGKLTEKVDMYSFGVLLLEIVMGRQNNGSQELESLITIAWKHFQQGTMEELFDMNLMLHDHNSNDTNEEILRVVHVALLCTQEAWSRRPSMSVALLMLVGKEHLPRPTKPPFMDEKTMELNAMIEDETLPILDHGSAASHTSFYPR